MPGIRILARGFLALALLAITSSANTAPQRPLPRQISGPDGAPMLLIPAGWFIMGSKTGSLDERPRRRVYLDAYYIDKYPVTNALFKKFGKPSHDFGSGFDKANQPVVGVTWFQARDYCRSFGKRLPTEAEWEKASRGTEGLVFPWGNKWDPGKVIWAWNSGSGPHPVDRIYLTHKSPYGVVDLEGNVWGWVADWYAQDAYKTTPDRNPKGPSWGTMRGLRGCSWLSDDPWGFRVAHRHRTPPGFWSHVIGFRCVVSTRAKL